MDEHNPASEEPQVTFPLKLRVEFGTGITDWSKTPGCLEWTATGRVVIRELDGDGQPAKTVFDHYAGDIGKARWFNVPRTGPSSAAEYLSLVAGQVTVRIWNIDSPVLWREATETDAQYADRRQIEGVPQPQWWLSTLKEYGVKTAYWGYVKSVGFFLAITLVVILFILLISFIP